MKRNRARSVIFRDRRGITWTEEVPDLLPPTLKLSDDLVRESTYHKIIFVSCSSVRWNEYHENGCECATCKRTSFGKWR